MKRILFVCGYSDAWTQVSKGIKPSQHMFGLHEMIDKYSVDKDGQLHGHIFAGKISSEPYEVDFYEWKSIKKDVLKHMLFFIKNREKYDLIYDCLNRCSIWIGFLKKINIIKTKIITMCHHPSYFIALNFSFSDAYIFFNNTYRKIAEKECKRKADKFYVNEWYPENSWYSSFLDKPTSKGNVFFIDNGKTERDRAILKECSEELQIVVNYPGDKEEEKGFFRSYKTDFSTYTKMADKLVQYHSLIIPVKKFKKKKIGPLGITSFLDAVALCIPIVTSDNTCFSDDIKKYHLGVVYKTGNKESLKKAMKKIYEDKIFYKECVRNLKGYKETRDIQLFSQKLQNIIRKLLQ